MEGACSVVRHRDAAARALLLALTAFVSKAPPFLCFRGSGGDASLGDHQRAENQAAERGSRPLEVLLLGSLRLRAHENRALGVQTPAGDPSQTALLFWGERLTAFQVEAERHFGFDLVDILTARPRGSSGPPSEVAGRNGQPLVDGQRLHSVFSAKMDARMACSVPRRIVLALCQASRIHIMSERAGA